MSFMKRISRMLGASAPSAHESARATFHCALCTELAGTVSVLMPGHSQALSKQKTIFINDFIGNERVVLSDEQANAIETALQNTDVRALYNVEKLFAPFYCPSCDQVYCVKHWKVIPVYDEQFFDHSYGYCPENHKRLIED